ncbi:MAG: hypothetical protein J1G04_04730 [Clostridiales bacterium]|nr:hypothetical protein [Clostridiales bacterium]
MSQQQKELDMKRIAGTLKYGWFDGGNRKILIVAYILFSLVCIGLGMGLLLSIVIQELTKNGGVNGLGDILSILGCLFMAFALPLVLGILIFRNEKYRKEINLWLSDAIELDAYAREIDVIKSPIPVNNIYKIRVEFNYDGNDYKYESRGKQLSATNDTYGFHNVWKDYINRPIKILYSPTYHEVIVLKDN